MFRKTSPICQCHLHSWKKCLKVPIQVLALMLPPWIVKSKKIQKIQNKIWWQRMTNVLSACHVSSGNNICGCRGKKNNQHSKIDYCHDFHECCSLMKLCKHLEHLSVFATIFFWIFLNLFRVYYSWWYQKS